MLLRLQRTVAVVVRDWNIFTVRLERMRHSAAELCVRYLNHTHQHNKQQFASIVFHAAI